MQVIAFGKADVNLGLSMRLKDIDGFPKISGDLEVSWALEGPITKPTSPTITTAPALGSKPIIALRRVQMDAGTFLAKIVKPIVDKINDVTSPIRPVVKAINARIPGISDAAKKDLSLATIPDALINGLFGLDIGIKGYSRNVDAFWAQYHKC
jgi:hypothetical protein